MPATATRTRITKATDPTAAKLAERTQAMAREAGLKSSYTPSEARGVIDEFTVVNKRGTLTITRAGQEPVKVKATILRAYADGTATRDDEGVADVAKQMGALAKGLPGTQYGRKLALFLLNRPSVRDAA